MADFNPYSTEGLLGLIGYDASSLEELFGQTFKDPKAEWSTLLQPEFKGAAEALGELPGQRRGLLGQLTSGLQERSFTAGRRIAGAAAGTGFAGSGQISQLGEASRRELGGEYGRGSFRITQDIQRREAGILAALKGNVGSFLAMLMAARPKLVSDVSRRVGGGGEYYEQESEFEDDFKYSAEE